MNHLVKNRNLIALPCVSAMLAALLICCAYAAAGEERFEHRWDPTAGQPGTNGPIRTLKVFDDGSGDALYAGGIFTEAGGLAVNNIARWDGEQWSDVGGGVWGEPDTPPPFGGFVPVRAIIEHDDGSGPALYVAGDFTHAGPKDAPVEAKRIARWDGTSWSALGVGFHAGSINALASFDGDLYVGGSTLLAGDLSKEFPSIARWDGQQWLALPGGFVGFISAFLVVEDGLETDPGADGPTLYVGGDIASAGGQPMSSVARWDGSQWSAIGLATGGGGDVRSLAIFDKGDGTGPELHLSSWDSVYRWTGEQWQKLENCTVWGSPSTTLGHINAIATVTDESGESLYLAGHLSGGCGSSHSIARWQNGKGHGMHFGAVRWGLPYNQLWGQAWAVEGFAPGNGDGVERVYVAGDFHYAGEFKASHIAAAYPVPAPAEKCTSSSAGTIQEPKPMEDAGFGCVVALHKNSALIRRCSLMWPAIQHAVWFFERDPETGEWEAQKMVEDMALGGFQAVTLWGNAAAVAASDETWIFERDEPGGEWSHVQTLDVAGSMSMNEPWLLIAAGSEVRVYQRDPDLNEWVQTDAIAPPVEGNVGVGKIDGNRVLVGVTGAGGVFVYEHDGEQWSEHSFFATKGHTVISGDTIARIAPVDTPKLNAVNIYVFEDGEWMHQDTVLPLNQYLDYMPSFCQVALSGDMLVAQACGFNQNWIETTVYVFKRFGDRWFLHTGFTPPTDGGHLVLSGDTVMVGAIDAWPWWHIWEGAVFVHDVSDCLPDAPAIPGDLTGDGKIGVADLLILLNMWGACADCEDCIADLTGDCNVGTGDLLILLGNWTGE